MAYIMKFDIVKVGELNCTLYEVKDGILPFDDLEEFVGGNLLITDYADLGEGVVLISNTDARNNGINPIFWLYSKKFGYVDKTPLCGTVVAIKLDTNKIRGNEDSFFLDGDEVASFYDSDILPLSTEEVTKIKEKIIFDDKGRFYLPLDDNKTQYHETYSEILRDMATHPIRVFN